MKTVEKKNEKEYEVFNRYLKERDLKLTGQRKLILGSFLEHRGHISAESLYQKAKEKLPHVGFATVYRTLKLLTQCGLAYEVDFHDGVARYEHSLNRRAHHHMICMTCGDSVEFFVPELEDVERRIGQQFRFRPSRHAFQIFGTCASTDFANSLPISTMPIASCLPASAALD